MDARAITRRLNRVLSEMNKADGDEMYPTIRIADVARAAGIEQGRVARLFASPRSASLETVKSAAIALHIDFEWLLFGNENDENDAIMWQYDGVPHSLRIIAEGEKEGVHDWVTACYQRLTEVVKATCQRDGFTPNQYCRAANINISDLYAMSLASETQHGGISLGTMEKIAYVAGLTVKEVLEDSECTETLKTRTRGDGEPCPPVRGGNVHEVDKDKVYTMYEAAAILHVTGSTVFRDILRGELNAVKENGTWSIKGDDLASFIEQRGKKRKRRAAAKSDGERAFYAGDEGGGEGAECEWWM